MESSAGNKDLVRPKPSQGRQQQKQQHEQLQVDHIFIDFRKAFDTVKHEELLSILYGIRGNTLLWIKQLSRQQISSSSTKHQ